MRGRYICFEGEDFSGKSTMVDMTASWLSSINIEPVVLRCPGTTNVGKRIRAIVKDDDVVMDPLTEALLFAADHSALMHQYVIPALAEGKWIISDRHNAISGIVYQPISGCDIESLDIMHTLFDKMPKIDLLFILQAGPSTISTRALLAERHKDRFESGAYEKVKTIYDKLAKEMPDRLLRFVRASETVPEKQPKCLYVKADDQKPQVFDMIRRAISSILLSER